MPTVYPPSLNLFFSKVQAQKFCLKIFLPQQQEKERHSRPTWCMYGRLIFFPSVSLTKCYIYITANSFLVIFLYAYVYSP